MQVEEMERRRPLLAGAGRYIQCEKALSFSGEEIAQAGKKAFVIGGRRALCVSLNKLEQSLKEAGVEYAVGEFEGHCTMANVERYAQKAGKFGAGVIVGVGGGKSIDTAKAVSNLLKLGTVTVPTSPATCAAYAPFSVIYSAKGEVMGNMHHGREMLAVIADMDIMTGRCPSRMLAAGIADAYAKYPEISFTSLAFEKENGSVMSRAALALAKFNTGLLYEKGRQACEDVEMKKKTAAADETVYANIALTGQVSGLVSGTKQLAAAHSFYNAVCFYFKDQQMAFLHGELVAVGVLLQMHLNGSPDEEIRSVRAFFKSIHVPVSFSDIGLEPSGKNMDHVCAFICEDTGIDQKMYNKKLKDGIEQWLK